MEILNFTKLIGDNYKVRVSVAPYFDYNYGAMGLNKFPDFFDTFHNKITTGLTNGKLIPIDIEVETDLEPKPEFRLYTSVTKGEGHISNIFIQTINQKATIWVDLLSNRIETDFIVFNQEAEAIKTSKYFNINNILGISLSIVDAQTPYFGFHDFLNGEYGVSNEYGYDYEYGYNVNWPLHSNIITLGNKANEYGYDFCYESKFSSQQNLEFGLLSHIYDFDSFPFFTFKE